MIRTILRFGINIILIAVFLFLEGAIVLAFVSDMYFTSAGDLERAYRWQGAENAYKRAVVLDPFNTEHLAALANFYLRRGIYVKKDKLPLFEEAEGLYERASALNPRCAEYNVTLGKVQAELFLEDAEVYGEKSGPAAANLKKALENDPNGFNTAFLAGYAIMPMWKDLDEKEKELVIDRLRYVLGNRPWHGNAYIYPRAWKYTEDFEVLRRITPDDLASNRVLLYFVEKNSLGQFYLEQKRTVDLHRQKEEPGEYAKEREEDERAVRSLRSPGITEGPKRWVGRSADRQHVYEGGRMYWTGTMHTLIDLSGEETSLNIEAKGTPTNGIFPYMIVELDGEKVGEVFVDSPDWKEYSFDVKTEGGVKLLSITYANNGSNRQKGEDRNLYIGEIRAVKNE